MAVKTASVTLDGSNLRFVATSGSGHTFVLDDGKGDAGPRPAELVPMALAGCTAMDVISILRKKRQDVTRYEVRAEGVQMDEHPNAFTRIDVLHVVEGPGGRRGCGPSRDRALRDEVLQRRRDALEPASPRSTTRTSCAATDGSEQTAEVLVLGPGADPVGTVPGYLRGRRGRLNVRPRFPSYSRETITMSSKRKSRQATATATAPGRPRPGGRVPRTAIRPGRAPPVGGCCSGRRSRSRSSRSSPAGRSSPVNPARAARGQPGNGRGP